MRSKHKARNATILARKIESARVRYRGAGIVNRAAFARIFEEAGIDPENEQVMKRYFLAKRDMDAAFSAGNAVLKQLPAARARAH